MARKEVTLVVHHYVGSNAVCTKQTMDLSTVKDGDTIIVITPKMAKAHKEAHEKWLQDFNNSLLYGSS